MAAMNGSTSHPFVHARQSARYLLLPEERRAPGDVAGPRIRRYRLARVGPGRVLPTVNPGPRSTGDFSHLPRVYD
jgi:hypothetical protein